MSRHLEPTAMDHARRAQTIKFSRFFDDEAVLETVANEYLAAVRSHDAHRREGQEANIGRMTVVYDRALAAVVGVEPLMLRVSANPIGSIG